jgi:hypothetical protein
MIPHHQSYRVILSAFLGRRPQAGEKNFFGGVLENTNNIFLYFVTRIFENFGGPFRDLKFSESPLQKNFLGGLRPPLLYIHEITL